MYIVQSTCKHIVIMKRKSSRSLPTLWEAVRIAFEQKVDENKWFQPRIASESANDAYYIDDYQDIIHPSKKAATEKKKKAWKTRKIGLRPTKQQKRALDTMIRGAAHAYNFALRLWTEHKEQFLDDKYKRYPDRKKLQKVVCCQKPWTRDVMKYFGKDDEWFIKDVHSTVKTHALKDFLVAAKEALKKTKAVLKFKDAECRQGGVFGIQKRLCTKKDERHINFCRNFGCGEIKLASKMLHEVQSDLKVWRSPRGKYYLLLPIAMEQRPMKEIAKGCMVGIDPGVRTFATLYDPSNCLAMQYGVQDDFEQTDNVVNKKSRKKRRERRKKSMSGITTKIDSVGRKRSNLLKDLGCKSRDDLFNKVAEGNVGRRKLKRYDFYSQLIIIAWERLKNKVTDLHRTLARRLVDNYEVIVIGKLEVSKFTKKKQGDNKWMRNMRRKMRMWGHYKFREALKFKAEEVDGCTVIIQDESWTSKTCGICGTRNMELGGKEIFYCNNCKYTTDRDVNGARNILRKYLKDFP